MEFSQTSVACCMPDGSCLDVYGIVGEMGAVQRCEEVFGGKSSYGPGLFDPFGGACARAQDDFPPPPGFSICGVSACRFTPIGGTLECANENYYQCLSRDPLTLPDWLRYGLCAVVVPINTQIKMAPVRERGFPYRLEFAMAASGFEHVCCIGGNCVPSTHESCTAAGGVWGLQPYYRFRGVFHDWWNNPIHRSQQPPAQMGRVFLDRRHRCVLPDGTVSDVISSFEECESFQGQWKWDGIPYLNPAVNLVHIHFSGCTTAQKNNYFSQQGFWYADPATLTAGGIYAGPPKWSGQIRYASNVAPDFLPPGIGYYQNAKFAEDYPYASSYQWMVLLPVDPLESLSPDCCVPPQCVPYCYIPDAPNMFPVNDTRTYEIPCYKRDHTEPGVGFVSSGTPYRNRSFGDGLTTPTVPAGVRGIVAYSPGDARRGYLHSYCSSGASGGGCPQTYGCDDYRCNDVWENIYRTHKGISAAKTYEWDSTPNPNNDPENAKWSVTYHTEIKSWFVQDSNWTLGTALQVVPFRWNAWYEGEVKAMVVGDISNAAFSSWIMSHDSGFGISFKPWAQSGPCNDVFMAYEGMVESLGDTVYPPAIAQANCKGSFEDYQADAPCHGAGRLSHWYRPDRGAPLPEQGLYHQTVRRRYTNIEKTQYTEQYGWAKLAFSTNVPRLIQAELE